MCLKIKGRKVFNNVFVFATIQMVQKIKIRFLTLVISIKKPNFLKNFITLEQNKTSWIKNTIF